MSPYRIACLGALVCTVVAWAEWGPWGGLAVAAPCVILLLIALPSVLGAADDIGSANPAPRRPAGRLTIGIRYGDVALPHDPDWPDWIDAEGEPMRRTGAIAGTDRQPYHAHSPEEDATCRNPPAGSPVSLA